MSSIDTFERKALFALTRALALVIVSVFLIGILGGIIWFMTTLAPEKSSKVAANEVLDVGL